jgi:hypothetical protein
LTPYRSPHQGSAGATRGSSNGRVIRFFLGDDESYPIISVDDPGFAAVVGGGQKGQSGGLLAHFTSSDVGGLPNKGATDPVLVPELFDPATGTFEQLCPKPRARGSTTRPRCCCRMRA